MHDEYTTPTPANQEPQLLDDRTAAGKSRPWAAHHRGTLALAALYDYMAAMDSTDRIISRRAARYLDLSDRLSRCAPWATFEAQADDSLRLHTSSFCRVRLCPMCQWRRSLKLAGQARQVVAEANRQYALSGGPASGYRWLMLTVTVRNVPAADLGAAVDHMHASLTRLTHRQAWPAVGWLRATEVTYNARSDTYHPHMHLLLCVQPSYFAGRSYLSKTRWIALWRDVARLDYDPSIDIHVVKATAADGSAGIGHAVAEIAKYGAKPADYIRPDDVDTSARVVSTLTEWLDGRRLTSWGGVLKQVAAALRLDDVETGDLIHIDGTTTTDATGQDVSRYIMYRWAVGWGNYAMCDSWDDAPAWQLRARADRDKANTIRARGQRDRAASARSIDIASTIATNKEVPICDRTNDGQDSPPQQLDMYSASSGRSTGTP